MYKQIDGLGYGRHYKATCFGGSSKANLCWLQALSPNKPYPAGVGGTGIALASDGGVALLSGSPASASRPASALLYSFYTSSNQYNACPQEIKVRPAAPSLPHVQSKLFAAAFPPYDNHGGRL